MVLAVNRSVLIANEVKLELTFIFELGVLLFVVEEFAFFALFELLDELVRSMVGPKIVAKLFKDILLSSS